MKLTHKLWVKILAVVLCVVSSFVGALSMIGIMIMGNYGFYNDVGSMSEESLENSFLNYWDYGYYDVNMVYEDLAYYMDSWQLFYNKEELQKMLAEYIEEYYPAGESRYGIRVFGENDETLFSSVEEGDAIYNMQNQQYQRILCSSLQQFLDRYGYNDYYTEYYGDNSEEYEGYYDGSIHIFPEISDKQDISIQGYGVRSFDVYKGEFAYQVYKSDYLQMFYMDMIDACEMLGKEQIMEMLGTDQAYVYSYNLRTNLTESISTQEDIENLVKSTKLVMTNLYSRLSENERVIGFMIYLNRDQVFADYGDEYKVYSQIYEWRYMIIALLAVCAFVFLSAFVFLLFACGHSGDTDEIHLNVIDRIPTDLYLLIMLMTGVVIICSGFYYSEVAAFIAVYSSFLLGFCTILSCTTRLKARVFWSGSLIGRLCGWIGKWLGVIMEGLPLIWKGSIGAILVFLINVVVWFDAADYYYDNFIAFGFLLNLIALIFALVFMAGYKKIEKAAKKMAEGNLGYQLDTARLYGSLRRQGEAMNQIGSNLEGAVAEQMKSERMRTELITNVSHDIKTPLTSIINYVDLLKKEEIPGDTAKQYLEVIDRQSARLKKLIVDLIEASKASTGNIEVNPVPTDVNELLVQTTAEYEQKMEQKNLEMVLNLLPETGIILADGRHIWRVLDNLLGNAYKYSMEGTRIYIDLLRADGQIVISVKNISNTRLNISTDELMERFVRGDSSRNTEGSGLGLSIARSLTELQGGTFTLEIDGDLFKCVLLFPEIKG